MLVKSVEVQSVQDLYFQFARFARVCDLADNPLHFMTRHIPLKATYYIVAEKSNYDMAEDILNKLSGRKKVRKAIISKQDARLSGFVEDDQLTIFYA